MVSSRTEAESLAIALRFGLIRVADAVRWADRQIELSDDPPSSLCDVAMASSELPQNVAHILRTIPGDCDYGGAIRLTLGYVLNALQQSDIDPWNVARALFDMAIAGVLPDGELSSGAFGYWDAIDLARDGYIEQSEADIVADMIQTIRRFVGDNS